MSYITDLTAILEALPEDATAEEVYMATQAYSRRDVMAAMYPLSRGGGGNPPASVLCSLASQSISLVGSPQATAPVWNVFSDNPYDRNPIDGIPDELGLTLAGNGRDFEFNENGLWCFTFSVLFPADATLAGYIGMFATGVATTPIFPGNYSSVTDILHYSSHDVRARIYKTAEPTSDPYVVEPILYILRLA